MKIVIPGGSGQVGTVLARAFHGDGHEVVVLSRSAAARPWRVVAWDGRDARRLGTRDRRLPTSSSTSPGAASIAATAPRTGARSWTRASIPRASSAQAIARAASPPRVWLQASTATIYAHSYDAPNDEHTGMLGGDEADAPDTWRFSIDVARAWERAFDEADHAAHPEGRAAVGDDDEPGSRRHLRHAARARAARPRRPRRRRPAVRLLDSRRRLRRRGSLADRARRRRRASSTSPRRIRCRTTSSCACCARQCGVAVRSAGEPAGCSRSARCSCAPRRS